MGKKPSKFTGQLDPQKPSVMLKTQQNCIPALFIGHSWYAIQLGTNFYSGEGGGFGWTHLACYFTVYQLHTMYTAD